MFLTLQNEKATMIHVLVDVYLGVLGVAWRLLDCISFNFVDTQKYLL